MFEAVFLLCAEGAEGPCRQALLPGYEAESRAACTERLRADPPGRRGAECREAGPALAFEEIAPGLYVHHGRVAEWMQENGGDIANLGFVVGEESVAVIDTGSSRAMAEKILAGGAGRHDEAGEPRDRDAHPSRPLPRCGVLRRGGGRNRGP